MVLYFSGTDNSKHVAESMCDERVVDIKEALQKKKCSFTVKKGEAVGIVCPVYYSGIPKTVLDFVRRMHLKGDVTYIYAILTHGGGPGAAGSMLEHELNKIGFELNAYFDVRMNSNYIMFGPLKATVEEEQQRLEEAEQVIASIKEKVDARENAYPKWSKIGKAMTQSMYLLCDRYMSTKKFYSDDRCVGCGICASRCPSKCIEMIEGKPVWTKDECVRCMACLRCNAVQYGEKTKSYRRYAYKTSCH